MIRDDAVPPLTIRILIEDRRRGLGLTKSELARRLGYRNIAKGLRRLDQVCDGRFEHAEALLKSLPDALAVDPVVVETAIAETLEQQRRAQEREWRAAFVPHAVILTERLTPEPIFVAAIIGVDRILRIDFDLSADRSTFVHQALAGIRARVLSWNRDTNPSARIQRIRWSAKISAYRTPRRVPIIGASGAR